MQFTVNDLGYKGALRTPGLKDILERNGFGVVEAKDPHTEEVVHATIWTGMGEEVAEGFPCGNVVRNFGTSVVRYTLTLDDFRLERGRIHGVLTDILNEYVRG